jgi:hypothetical protein
MTKTIDSIWAAVAIDEADNIEGICAVQIGQRMMPLIAADEARLPFVRTEAEAMAARTGQTIVLIRLTKREVVEIFNPGGTSGHH